MFKQLLQSYKKMPIPFGSMGIALLVVCFFFIAKEYTNHLVNNYNFPFSWFYISLKILINYALWLILAPWVSIISRKVAISGKTFFKWVGLAIGVIVISNLHRILAIKIYDIIYFIETGYMKEFFGPNSMVTLAVGSFSSFIELLVIMAVFVGADYQKQYLKNQQALINAQISTLQMQLHPHFLFNTLHSISSMIDIDTQKAQKMLTKIGTLLRSLLESEMEQMTTVQQEMEFIKHYLDLEQIRYMDKMQIEYYIPKDVLDAKIPNMIVQPLVENAIKYGVVPATENGKINIWVERINDKGGSYLKIQISNSLEHMEQPLHEKGTGLGLKNSRRRLEGIYGDQFTFEAGTTSSDLYIAKIQIPYKTI
ncbi:sensor histidine kinase [Flagellimonas sp. S3867]|uniref:sensor histidine kinase n=1 Tax=Flagellimonas sp. S3867 TaxID=2768063 RepID=UPI001681C7C9|nr:histidine kinase [Flagellimonas sp. S3867]